jgi:glyoxylase-like metal-dependent hydrolase (beta-lactamase superfamily II)
VDHLAPRVWTHRVVAQGFPTVCAVVLTPTRAFVVDTLCSPQDVQPVLDLLEERAGDRTVVVVNTHHHWDHVYGNAAFAGRDIVAHRSCSRLMLAQRANVDGAVPPEPPEGVPLPTVTFGDRLSYSDEPETVHLIHAPGHTEDSIVVFAAQAGILFAGDALEWPLPSFAQRGSAESWVATLRRLKQLPADLVVPAHGAPQPKSLIDANERYVQGVHEAVAAARAKGVRRAELDLPVRRFLPQGTPVDAVYEASHAANLVRVWDGV